METPSDDPIARAAEGAAKAVINKGIDFIKTLAQKFKNRKIAFVQDKKTLENVREDLKSNELKFYKSYIDDKNLLTQIVIGLTLRKLEERRDNERIEGLRSRLFERYDTGGVHIAQAVQSGIVSRYITYLVEIHASEEIMKNRLMFFLENVEAHVCFVRYHTEVEKEIEKIIIKLSANSPEVFVISGMRGATEKASEIITKVDEKRLTDYYREDYSKINRGIAFFHKILKN